MKAITYHGKSVAVFGAGPVGLLSGACARMAGAEDIYLVDHHAYRLQFSADTCGAIPINFKEQDDPAEQINQAANGHGVDASIDAVGFEAKGSTTETILTAVKIESSSGAPVRQCIAATRRSGVISVPASTQDGITRFLFADALKGSTYALRAEIEDIDKARIFITLIQPSAVNTPYPQHVKNHMSQEPALPTPQIDPMQVASIVNAAESPTRDVKVGAMSKLNTIMFKILPSLADKTSAKQVDRQQYDEPPRNPEGALYTASGGRGVHGVHGPRPH